MPISDNYVVQYLIQNSTSRGESLVWREAETEGYVTCLNGIKVEFGCLPSRTGARSYLTFSASARAVQIVEPHNIGFFRPKYANEDEERLAAMMKDLARVILRQCAARRKMEAECAGSIRESMYRRLLGAPVTES